MLTFAGCPVEEAAGGPNVGPAPGVNARVPDLAEGLNSYTTVWSPDSEKWDFIVDAWISDGGELLTAEQLLARYGVLYGDGDRLELVRSLA